MATNSNGARPDLGRVLPAEAEGILCIGVLDFLAVSDRNEKQLVCDIVCRQPNGRRRVETLTAFIADQNGVLSAIGEQFSKGGLHALVGHPVIANVRLRASKDNLYMSVEGLHALAEAPAPASA